MRRRRFRRPSHALPLPKRPYRDSVLFHGVLSLCIVGVAAVTGGGILRAVAVGAAFFVVATGWSWWRFRERIATERGKQ